MILFNTNFAVGRLQLSVGKWQLSVTSNFLADDNQSVNVNQIFI